MQSGPGSRTPSGGGGGPQKAPPAPTSAVQQQQQQRHARLASQHSLDSSAANPNASPSATAIIYKETNAAGQGVST